MAVIIVALGELLDQVAMPALAGLLIVVGFRTISPADFGSVWRTGGCAKGRPGDHIRAHDHHPDPVCGAYRGWTVSAPLRRRSVEQGNDSTSCAYCGWANGRDRAARPASRERGGRSPAVRQHVLRGGSDVRRLPAERRAPIAKFCRHLAPARTQRHRLDLHRSSSPIRGKPHDRRIEARHRVGERTTRRSTASHGSHRLHRRRKRLSLDRAGRGMPWNAHIKTR